MCVCSLQIIDEEDVALIARHDELAAKLVDSRIAAAEAAIQAAFYRRKLAELKSTMRNEDAESTPDRRRVETEITECEQTISRFEREIRMRQIIESQNFIMENVVDDVRNKYVLRRLSFWQQTLNYTLYLIFICNAFITGLGLTGK